jgi:hypothetical protein
MAELKPQLTENLSTSLLQEQLVTSPPPLPPPWYTLPAFDGSHGTHETTDLDQISQAPPGDSHNPES